MESKEGKEDVSRGSVIAVTSSVEQKQANLDLSNVVEFTETLPSYETSISDTKIDEINVNFSNFDTSITDAQITEISSSRLDYETLISDGVVSQSKQLEVDVFNSEIIGLDPDGISRKMDLVSDQQQMVLFLEPQEMLFNNYKKEKVRVWVIKKEKKFKQKVQLNPLDSSLGTIVSESTVRTKTIVSFTSPSGSVSEIQLVLLTQMEQ